MATGHPLIRKAQNKDLPVLNRLSKTIGNFEDAYFEACLLRGEKGERDFYVALLDGRICGYVMLVWQPRYTPFRRLKIPEIQDLNVAPTHRRRGVGAALVTYCENQARAKGSDTMGIAVGLHKSYGPAQRLYVRMGYVPDGAGVFYDNVPVEYGSMRPMDDAFTLKVTKDL